MDSTNAVTHVSLCAGYGGIDLGLKRAIPSLRTIAFSEIEAFACANLVAKMEAGHLDAAPIWSNLKTFPWDSFRDRVDILSGGYPCQPFSSAGKRLGTDDPRHLWPFIADGISRMRPRLCIFENVEGHITLGLREVIAELESLGYRTTWGIFSAAEVGAPHQRKRVFILAHRIGTRLEGLAGHGDGSDEPGRFAADAHGSTRSSCLQLWPSLPGQPQFKWEPPRTVAYSGNDAGERRNTVGQVPCGHDGAQGEGEGCCGGGSDETGQRKVSQPLRSGSEPIMELGDTASLGLCGGPQDGLGQQPEVFGQGYEAMGNAPNSGSSQRRPGEVHQSRAEQKSQRPDARAERQTEPSLGRDADGSPGWLDYAQLCFTCDNRTDELRLLGNGVVPATAERAFRVLIKRLMP